MQTLPVSTLPLVCRYTILNLWSVWVRRSRLGCWIAVMDRRDALRAALQLQRDAGLMSSNLTVLRQYAIALHRMPTEVLHTMSCQQLFPSGVHTDGRDGTLVPSGWTGRARTGYCAPWRRLPGLYQVSYAAIRLAVCTGLTGLTSSRFMLHLDITEIFR